MAVQRSVFYNYMETNRMLRNKCAHGGCIYRMDFPKGIKRLPADISAECRHNIKVYRCCWVYAGVYLTIAEKDLENDIIQNLVSSIQFQPKVIAQVSKMKLNSYYLVE